jgi:hypothetical protein
MMKIVGKSIAVTICTAFVFTAIPEMSFAAAKVVKKDRRSTMTDAQKQDLRRRGREWCLKNHAKGNSQILSIDILTDGSIRCWFR